MKIKFGGKANRPKHSHRVFTQAGLRVTDQHQPSALDVFHATGVIPDTEVGNIVIERVAGEIASPDIFVDRAINIVTKNPALVIEGRVNIGIFVIRGSPKGCDLDDLPPEAHMRQAKTPPDQPAVAK